MESTGALINNLHLKNNPFCFKCLHSSPVPKTSSQINTRKPKPASFSNKTNSKQFARIVCSAVEDATEKQQELSRGSLNGADLAVEDRKVLEWNCCKGYGFMSFCLWRIISSSWCLEVVFLTV
ncbi:uncharacterized protein LOC111398990 [Olea europaea var. sylvestris]|uniref:uncharacterized protein LOC111398990 n=1 Tax=Olea europaea var. sylvestris TaxID=158386 RepID=UPI000C1D82AC|nr:uncharacterized protein LOC111398990 [Olea europaea var. sylvestris]